MSVSAVNSAVADTTSATAYAGYSLSIEDFYTLLITELQYQDPTDPVDNDEMISQITGYSQLEALDSISEGMDALLLYQQSLNSAQAVSFIGKTVTAETNELAVSNQSSNDIKFELEGDASKVAISIYDSEGELVREIDAGSLAEGEHSLTWDCLDDDGNALDDGSYSFEVEATDAEGETVGYTASTTSVVQGVSFESGVAYLKLANGASVSLSSVTDISGS